MSGNVSAIAAMILIRGWYRSQDFSEEQIDGLMHGQIEDLKRGATFDFDNGTVMSMGSDGKFYVREI
jgi:hypothetical protein